MNIQCEIALVPGEGRFLKVQNSVRKEHKNVFVVAVPNELTNRL